MIHIEKPAIIHAAENPPKLIGLVLVGGMAIGTLFTLFVIPSIYILVARDHSRDRAPDAVEIF